MALIVIIIYGTGSVYGYYRDGRTASGNTFVADRCWTQTTRADFTAGVQSNVDLAAVPGDVVLGTTGGHYRASGTEASQVFDSGKAGTSYDLLAWYATLPASTGITFQVRASNTSFAKGSGSPAWTSVGGTSPVATGLPKGRYFQWRATLTTSNNAVSPALHSVDVWYN